MNLTDILIIASAVLVLILLWIIISYQHLKHTKETVAQKWEETYLTIRKRTDKLPNLIETVRKLDNSLEPVIQKIIEIKTPASKEYDPGAKKMELEYELSQLTKQLFDGAEANLELKKDTNYLILKKEFDDLDKEIEKGSQEYNEEVRYFNRHRHFFLVRPLAALFKFPQANIFEFEK